MEKTDSLDRAIKAVCVALNEDYCIIEVRRSLILTDAF